MPSLRIVCSSCGNNFSAPVAGPATCRADGCAAPVCAPCAEALFPGRCAAHPWTPAEKLKHARARYAAGDPRVPLIVTLSDAKQSRQQCLAHFEQVFTHAQRLPDLITNRRIWAKACRFEAQRYPRHLNTTTAIGDSYTCFSIAPKLPGGSFNAQYEMRVVGRGCAFRECGFDVTPLGQDEASRALDAVLNRDQGLQLARTYAVGLASLTGWTADVKNNWRSQSIHDVRPGLAVFLVDLRASSVVYHWFQEPNQKRRSVLDALVEFFSPPRELEAACEIVASGLRDLQNADLTRKASLTCPEAAEKFNLRPALAAEAFRQLERQWPAKYDAASANGEIALLLR